MGAWLTHRKGFTMTMPYKIYSSSSNLVAATMYPVNAVSVAVSFKGAIIKYAPTEIEDEWVVWEYKEWEVKGNGSAGYWDACEYYAEIIKKRIKKKRNEMEKSMGETKGIYSCKTKDEKRFYAMKAYGLRGGQVNKLMAHLDAQRKGRKQTYVVALEGESLKTLRRESNSHYLHDDQMLERMVFWAIERAYTDHVKAGTAKKHLTPFWHEVYADEDVAPTIEQVIASRNK